MVPGFAADFAVVLVHAEQPVLRGIRADDLIAGNRYIGVHLAQLRVRRVELAKTFQLFFVRTRLLESFEGSVEVENPRPGERRQQRAVAGRPKGTLLPRTSAAHARPELVHATT